MGMLEQILLTLSASLIGGGITAVATVAAIRTDVGWLKITVQELRSAISRAHERIDALDRRPH